MFVRLIYIAVFIAACLVGWRLWGMNQSYESLLMAPFGQVEGAENPAFTFAEILDYRCNACRRVGPVVEEVLKHNPDLRVVYRHYPVFGKVSLVEAQLALAAGKQGKFLEMHRLLMARDEPIADSDIDLYAKELGLDLEKLRKDMKSRDVGLDFLRTVQAAELLNINATPTFIFGKTVYTPHSGLPSVEELENKIAEARGLKKPHLEKSPHAEAPVAAGTAP